MDYDNLRKIDMKKKYNWFNKYYWIWKEEKREEYDHVYQYISYVKLYTTLVSGVVAVGVIRIFHLVFKSMGESMFSKLNIKDDKFE